jgi:hypothetical protein
VYFVFDIIRLHWQYVIPIVFPRQQTLRERAQMIFFLRTLSVLLKLLLVDHTELETHKQDLGSL